MTLKLKLTILSSVMMSLLLLCLGSITYLTFYNRVLYVEETNLNGQALVIGQKYASQLSDVGRIDPAFDKWLDQYDKRNQQISIYTPEGKIVTTVGTLVTPPLTSPITASNQSIVRQIRSNNKTLIDVIRPVQSDEIPGRTLGYVLFISDVTSVYGFLHLLLLMLVAGSIGAVLVAGGVWYWIASRTLKPIDELIEIVEGFEANQFDTGLEASFKNDEVARLTKSFRTMLARVQKAFAQQTRFVADASHEIRTPLTTIIGYTELLDKWGKSDPAVVQEGISAIRNESLRLTKLADDLLLLAGLEARQIESNATTDVDTVLADTAKTLSLLYLSIHLGFELQAHVNAKISPDHFKQIATNLIGNAFKYTPADGWVRIMTRRRGSQIAITIQDSGSGIDAADLPHVFERLYRSDKSREREQGGNGLGLAIVKELVDAYHGSITIESQLGVGTTVTVTLASAQAL